MDKYKLGDPIQTKKTKWKGYIAYIYDEENFRISCAGYPTFSHTSNRHIDEIEPRKMPRSEINIQQQFRALVEHGAVPASIVRELRKSISSSKENQEYFNKRRRERVKEFKSTIDAQAKEIKHYEKTCLDYVDSLASREARIAELEAELNRKDSEIPNYKQQLTQANVEIKYLAKNLHEIDSANEGEYQTYTAEQWIEKAKESTSAKTK